MGPRTARVMVIWWARRHIRDRLVDRISYSKIILMRVSILLTFALFLTALVGCGKELPMIPAATVTKAKPQRITLRPGQFDDKGRLVIFNLSYIPFTLKSPYGVMLINDGI